MTTNDLVSIMMPAYNAEHFIGPAIESVLAQTYPDWELVIVNDGSTDHTAEVIAHHPDPRIRTFHQPNRGEAVARNTALSHLQGKFVAFLDADDQFLPRHLEITVRYLQDHAELSGVYTDGYYFNRHGDYQETLASRRRGPFEGYIFEQVLRASDAFGPPLCLVLRRQTIIDHQLAFDPDIVIGPDWDFEVRFAEVGSFGYLNELTTLYRVHQTNITLTIESQKRKLSLARCREKAIKLNGFRTCSIETRWYAFYDLLINSLTGFPERQEAITHWPEFDDLPADQQAQILRLMASRAIHYDLHSAFVGQWLRRARTLNPTDRRSQWLANLYQLNPRLCALALHVRAALQTKAEAASPFGKLE